MIAGLGKPRAGAGAGAVAASAASAAFVAAAAVVAAAAGCTSRCCSCRGPWGGASLQGKLKREHSQASPCQEKIGEARIQGC